MRIRQWETHASVIELCVQPRIHRVTCLAIGRETRAHVVRAGRRLKVVCVAGVALRR